MTGGTECTVAYGIVSEIQRDIGRKSRFSHKLFTARRACIARTMRWQDVCLSVRLSDTQRYSLETAKHIVKLFLRQVGTPTAPVLLADCVTTGSPGRRRNTKVGKIC